MRVVYIIRIYYFTYDMTWESLPALMWCAIEAHVAVICASAPALKVFFKETLGSTLVYRRGSETYQENSGPSLEQGDGSIVTKKDMWQITADVDHEKNVEAQLERSAYMSSNNFR
jgi:hypothetical protein